MELTQEYFDKGLSNLINKIDSKIDSKIDEQTRDLKDYTHQAFETQQQWMKERFKELIVMYDVKERVEKLEQEMPEMKLQRTHA